MAILLKTFQKDDTFYLKKGNTERVISMSLITDTGDVAVLAQQDHTVSVTLTAVNRAPLVIPATLIDVFGTVGLSLSDDNYKYLGVGSFQGSISVDNKRVEGTFYLVIADSGVTF